MKRESNKGCLVCGSSDFAPLFSRDSGRGEIFSLVKCRNCGLEFIHPAPDPSVTESCYGLNYFTVRTDRGYNNYFSPEQKAENERVFTMNLRDLNFFDFEKTLAGKKSSLDIGCAAGYFVSFMKQRGWTASGIDISEPCVNFAAGAGLDVVLGNYLETEYREPFDCITMWASIEHLQRPDLFLRKARRDLRHGGRLYISTCCAGSVFMKLAGRNWRFYNFPEHLVYFSLKNLSMLMKEAGFTVEKAAFYGSGFGSQGSVIRHFADFAAKKFRLGDMMIISGF